MQRAAGGCEVTGELGEDELSRDWSACSFIWVCSIPDLADIPREEPPAVVSLSPVCVVMDVHPAWRDWWKGCW